MVWRRHRADFFMIINPYLARSKRVDPKTGSFFMMPRFIRSSTFGLRRKNFLNFSRIFNFSFTIGAVTTAGESRLALSRRIDHNVGKFEFSLQLIYVYEEWGQTSLILYHFWPKSCKLSSTMATLYRATCQIILLRARNVSYCLELGQMKSILQDTRFQVNWNHNC